MGFIQMSAMKTWVVDKKNYAAAKLYELFKFFKKLYADALLNCERSEHDSIKNKS